MTVAPYTCGECQNLGHWRQRPLVLRFDAANQRYLCPNCDSQIEVRTVSGTYEVAANLSKLVG